jgi:predicted phosphodiesterase
MDLAKKLEELRSPGRSGSDLKKVGVPEDWRSRMDIDSVKGGFVISAPRPEGEITDATTVLEDFGLDPREWTVSSMRRGKWQKFDGDYLESVRVNLVPTGQVAEDGFDVESLMDEIKKWRPSKGIKKSTGTGAFMVAPSDQQIGKKAGDQGTPQSIGRLLQLTDSAVHRFEAYKRMGLSLGTICLALPGDHVEGNTSQHGRLQGLAASDLGLTEQTRVARRLLLAQIKAFAPLTDHMIVPVVNGNHDEVTRQVAADPADGWNVEIASAVQDICAENPELAHIEFRYPSSGHQTLTVNVAGSMLGLFHGHQAGQNNIMKFLSGHAAGQTALGMADLWVSGHYHNFRSMDISDRLWLQCPTTDPGSEWFRDRSGMESKPGLLTTVIGGDFEPREFISVLAVKGEV